jgi:hypothetical protein
MRILDVVVDWKLLVKDGLDRGGEREMRERLLAGKLLSFIQLHCLRSGVIFFTEISRELDARERLKERLLSTTASDLGSFHNYVKPFPTKNGRKRLCSVQYDFDIY